MKKEKKDYKIIHSKPIQPMKKNSICVLLTITLLLFCILTTYAQTVKISPNYAPMKAQEGGTTTIYKIGDVNGDDQVDISDIVAIINLIAQNDKSNKRADVNNDGVIDVSDIVKVINIIANGGEEEEFIRLSNLTKMMLNGTSFTVMNGNQVKEYSITGGLELSLTEPGTNADMKFLDIYSGGKVVTSISFTGTDKIEIGDEGFVNFWMEESIVHQTTTANIDSILVYDQLQEPLVYLGVTGFNQALYEKQIGVLDKNTVADYKSFISSLTTKYGTILYYAADNALDRITEYQFKTPLRSVNLITFTDGLDQGSHALCDTYVTDKNYLSHLKSRIASTRVNNLPLTAYSVGLCGSDVTDLAQFQSNIRSLASSTSNAFEETSMNDVKTRLDNIAQDIINRINIQKLTFTIPVPGNGTKVRIVLDGEAAGNSKAYIEGTYQISDKSLHNVTMKGITSDGATSIGTLTGKANGIFVTYTVPDIIADFLISVGNIQQYSLTSTSSTWQENSEFDSGSAVTEIHHSGSLVFLLLDCSSSMSSDFSNMISYANSFISQIANNTNTVQERPFGLLKPEKGLKISTEFIDFGKLLAGDSNSKSFTVTNVSSFYKSFKVSIPNGVFKISDNGETFTLGPGDSKIFNVVFSSDACDQYTSEITIKSTDGIETYKIKLSAFTDGGGGGEDEPLYETYPFDVDLGEMNECVGAFYRFTKSQLGNYYLSLFNVDVDWENKMFTGPGQALTIDLYTDYTEKPDLNQLNATFTFAEAGDYEEWTFLEGEVYLSGGEAAWTGTYIDEICEQEDEEGKYFGYGRSSMVTGGTIKATSDGTNVTFDIDLTTETGNKIVGKYSGKPEVQADKDNAIDAVKARKIKSNNSLMRPFSKYERKNPVMVSPRKKPRKIKAQDSRIRPTLNKLRGQMR